MKKPTIEEIAKYSKEVSLRRGLELVDAKRFFDYYESKGWKVGKSAMVSWKACMTGQWYGGAKPIQDSAIPDVSPSQADFDKLELT
jgi:hypothetical protein